LCEKNIIYSLKKYSKQNNATNLETSAAVADEPHHQLLQRAAAVDQEQLANRCG
jgi:hypothetical protein